MFRAQMTKKVLGVTIVISVCCSIPLLVSTDLTSIVNSINDIDLHLPLMESNDPASLTQQGDVSHSQPSKAICFITCAYSDNILLVDKIGEPTLGYHTGFRHILFTNLPDLKPLGWTQIVTNFNFSSRIVESRFPKFMGWKLPEIQESCRVAIYHDGNSMTSDRPDAFIDIADRLLSKPSNILSANQNPGWMQYVSKRAGPLDELKAILRYNKDTKEHVKQTVDWLFSNVPTNVTNPTEWINTIRMYSNPIIAYDPTSRNFQHVTEDFWSVYSAAMTTWRDQPLWSYFVHMHKLTPLAFPENSRYYFKKRENATGFNGHTYT
jgi:hypothetical protein